MRVVNTRRVLSLPDHCMILLAAAKSRKEVKPPTPTTICLPSGRPLRPQNQVPPLQNRLRRLVSIGDHQAGYAAGNNMRDRPGVFRPDRRQAT